LPANIRSRALIRTSTRLGQLVDDSSINACTIFMDEDSSSKEYIGLKVAFEINYSNHVFKFKETKTKGLVEVKAVYCFRIIASTSDCEASSLGGGFRAQHSVSVPLHTSPSYGCPFDSYRASCSFLCSRIITALYFSTHRGP